ncbi:MAG: RusA family crossover junction endodeoxyribonuclease [Candidatus Spechtbacteria bacterium SB0662_bin_43]|uniref:RusA family crossover junction endodeoxyribonuclease n=1 Tax=Candidatus Spechtbacteria bacterium SB0662_bin_43 TaxID=2604897 RepID=A0A845DC42_9BACT|nr:RusA family crossover junction endodeoxyribonuclease [Candidatus Spechtbacteria bacterium SB0662_bin_43]
MNISLKYDYPPSVDNMYKKNKQGRIYLKPEAVQYKKDIGLLAKSAMNRADFIMTKRPIRLTIEEHIYINSIQDENYEQDIDNCVKVLQDGLEGVVYKNDKQIRSLRVKKYLRKEEGKSYRDNYVYIYITDESEDYNVL